jgi:hypothetical protein
MGDAIGGAVRRRARQARAKGVATLMTLVARADKHVREAQQRAYRAMQVLGSTYLSARQREQVSVSLYDIAFRPSSATRGLYEWERVWFERRLARPPARVLVGGAGGGRECAELLALGYHVDAFEPSTRAHRELMRGMPTGHLALRGDYAALNAAVLDGASNELSRLADGRTYDAVLLGWGSLTHVLDYDERARLMHSCNRLCPRGPILASFWMRSIASPRGRAETFRPWLGFASHLEPWQVEQLSRAIGRRVRWEHEGDYAHVTFQPIRREA